MDHQKYDRCRDVDQRLVDDEQVDQTPQRSCPKKYEKHQSITQESCESHQDLQNVPNTDVGHFYVWVTLTIFNIRNNNHKSNEFFLFLSLSFKQASVVLTFNEELDYAAKSETRRPQLLCNRKI